MPPGTPPPPKFTGITCWQCRQHVAIIESQRPGVIVFCCPACGYRWAVSEPGAKPL